MSSSTNNSTAGVTEITINNQTVFAINMSNVTKLNSTNYLMWSLQTHALLDGYDLAGYLDGTIASPPPTLTNDDQIVVNPAFSLWKRQDKLIYSALIGAISPSLQPLVSRAATSFEVWSTLASTYANQAVVTSNNSRHNSKIGRKKTRQLMSISKVSQHALISWLFLARLLTMKIR